MMDTVLALRSNAYMVVDSLLPEGPTTPVSASSVDLSPKLSPAPDIIGETRILTRKTLEEVALYRSNQC